jgi:uncharacterized membrane protein
VNPVLGRTLVELQQGVAFSRPLAVAHPQVLIIAHVADDWAAVLQPPAWTPEKTDRLRLMLHANE